MHPVECPRRTPEAITALVRSVELRWRASADYLRERADNPDADPAEAEEAYQEVCDALDALQYVESDAAERVRAIVQDHNPRDLPTLEQAVRQLAASMEHADGDLFERAEREADVRELQCEHEARARGLS